MQKIQAHKTHKTKETQIYVVHPVWAASTPNSQSFLSIILQNLKRQNLQQICCNILCSLSQSPYMFPALGDPEQSRTVLTISPSWMAYTAAAVVVLYQYFYKLIDLVLFRIYIYIYIYIYI